MKRVIAHWTAGAGRASAEDKAHYHRLVEYDGTVVAGAEAVEDNIVTSDGDYAAHTLRLNTGSIGVAMCGMRGAVEHPFDAGPSPLNEAQFNAFCKLVADLCVEYGIRHTPDGPHACRGPDNAWGAAAGQMGCCAAALAGRSPRGSISR